MSSPCFTPFDPPLSPRIIHDTNYYAVFCKARNCVKDYDGQDMATDGRVHRQVKEFYKFSSDKKRKKVGMLLDRLRISRNKADYDNTIVSLLKDSESALVTASRIMELLKEIYPDL